MLSLLIDTAFAAGNVTREQIVGLVSVQALNFIAFLLIMTFILRKKVKAYYSEKQSSFLAALEKAEAVKKEAAAKQQAIQTKITQLEASYAANIKEAEQNAEKLRLEIVAEAEKSADALKTEAQNASKTQLREAISRLKADLFSTSVKAAEQDIQSKMQKQDHVNIQEHLVKSFGAAK